MRLENGQYKTTINLDALMGTRMDGTPDIWHDEEEITYSDFNDLRAQLKRIASDRYQNYGGARLVVNTIFVEYALDEGYPGGVSAEFRDQINLVIHASPDFVEHDASRDGSREIPLNDLAYRQIFHHQNPLSCACCGKRVYRPAWGLCVECLGTLPQRLKDPIKVAFGMLGGANDKDEITLEWREKFRAARLEAANYARNVRELPPYKEPLPVPLPPELINGTGPRSGF